MAKAVVGWIRSFSFHSPGSASVKYVWAWWNIPRSRCYGPGERIHGFFESGSFWFGESGAFPWLRRGMTCLANEQPNQGATTPCYGLADISKASSGYV